MAKYTLHRKRPRMVKLRDVAFSLEEGEISPFKTDFGWHILTVEKSGVNK